MRSNHSAPKPGPAQGGARKNRKKRRRRGPPGEGSSLAAVLSSSRPIDTTKSADTPLNREEAAAMRQHFRVLREFRRELRLKVNASEDLLLNGIRDPEHRGLCQHLLAKVDRASVLAAVERLDPAGAARLLEGVLGFAPQIEYVLLYLEAVKKTASQARATRALSQGLKQIDFSQVSSGQMRRVLDLIVELFDAGQHPHLLLGLLESRKFRTAFDESVADLPEPLARLVVPLRAVQEQVLHAKPGRGGTAELLSGVGLLLKANEEVLVRYPADIRRKLFEIGLLACEEHEQQAHRSLRALVDSFPAPDRTQSELGITLARHLLAAERDEEARKLLNALADRYPDFQLPGRWLAALDMPRVGRFSLADRSPPSGKAAGSARLQALFLATMRPAWIWIAEGRLEQPAASAAELHGRLCLPGVVPLLGSGRSEQGRFYYAVPSAGQKLNRALGRKSEPAFHTVLRICGECAALLGSLAAAGVMLPDARLERFDLEGESRLWLVDLQGAVQGDVNSAGKSHVELARGFFRAVLERSRQGNLSGRLLRAVEEAPDCAELARIPHRPL